MAIKAPLKDLRLFFRDTIGMNNAEAGGYITRLRNAGIDTQERADDLLSHLKKKYEQGRVGGEHSDANLDDTLRSALGIKSSDKDTIGLGGRIYGAGQEHAKLEAEQIKDSGKQLFQRYQNFRNQQQTVNGATAAAANVESSGVSKATQKIYDDMAYNDAVKQFFNDPRAKGIAKEYNIEENKDGMQRVLNIVRGVENAGPVQKMFATGGQKPLSGKTLQEGTLSYAYDPEKVSDLEKMSSISDLGFSRVENGMKMAAREFSVDEAKLRSLIKQNDMPGTKAANDMLYGKVKKGLESQHASIMKSDLSEAEKITKWNTAREEAIERLKNGATFQDYFFGNRVHHGLAGMAAITGTLGVAFGGHKSNAELYSSPF